MSFIKFILNLFLKQIEEPMNTPKSELPYKHLIESETARKLGIDNTPNDEQIKNLQQLNLKIYTPIKTACDKAGKELILSSGFRSEALNKHVGGAQTSDHCKGLALDLICGDNNLFYEFLKGLNLPYKQLILEMGWNHISLDLNDVPRKQNLESYKEDGITKYREI